MTLSLKPMTTTLIGGAVFLLPLIVVLTVLGQGLALMAGVAQSVAAMFPNRQIGGVALVSLVALLLLLCYGAGLLARAALGRSLSARRPAADARGVVFLPGAPDPRSGSVVLVSQERVAGVPVEIGALHRSLKSIGRDCAALLSATLAEAVHSWLRRTSRAPASIPMAAAMDR